MKQNDYQKILANLKRFDVEISHRQVDSVAGAALRFVEEQLQQPYVSLVLYDPDKKSLRVLTRSEGDTVTSEPFLSGGRPDIIALAMETSEAVYCQDVPGEKKRGDALLRRVPEEIRSMVVLPLRTAETVVGTLNVGSRRAERIAADQQVFLEAAATRLTAALRSARVLEELHSACERLQKECDLQKSALEKSRDELELEVARRTAEIQKLQERLQAENIYLKEELAGAHTYGGIIGESSSLKTVISRIELVAPTDANVLILGESGTGKELIAREIHAQSARKDRPLIKVNCATIPKELYESEFFGHVKGAFTGAVSDRMGRFEAADGGTLFLDEVGEIPPSLQGKLLRVLQEGEFERVGEGRTRKVDVRIIAATNKNLMEEIKNGRFREDLYYRLNVFPIELTPLRDRKEDIPLLATHFTEVLSRRLNRSVPRLTEANLMDMKAHDWPGNVRELQNIIERALILSPHGHLHFDLPRVNSGTPLPGQSLSEAASSPTTPIMTEADFAALQKQNMLAALIRFDWKIYGKDGAAQLLGIKPTTLIERMRRLNIKRPG
ncbi:MAG TPA: sigma 54-interacting transcriptional regulator [Desulfobacterales bacterium]|nr:sigma 54-interacting transcriptional regulator [Desulfobacterales bacterium]